MGVTLEHAEHKFTALVAGSDYPSIHDLPSGIDSTKSNDDLCWYARQYIAPTSGHARGQALRDIDDNREGVTNPKRFMRVVHILPGSIQSIRKAL